MAENKPKEIRYQEILDAASSCFAENGYLGTSVDDICKRAGITKGGLYWHFGSKKKVLIALIDELCNTQQQIWQELEHLEISDNSFREVGRWFIKSNLEHEDKVRLFAMLEMESLRDPEIKQLLVSSRLDIHNALIRFSKKILNFYGTSGVDVESFAHFLNVSVSGIVQRKIIELVDIDALQCWDMVSEVIIKGLQEKE